LIQETLNGDLKDNGLESIKQNKRYQGDHHLWEKIPDFSYQYPDISQLGEHYGRAALCLILWLVVLVSFSRLAIRRIEREGQ
jgi:hypothetical protein